ncbi:MAG: SUMF1/EgtB/PvdO family nonheme iron enzyme [Polyangiaceae bacterium]|nr:SUMF1/EgtB/PvdO family nonheme iron enzyme [Polyangiaceae bacterium]
MLKVTCGQCGKMYQIPLEKLHRAVHHATCTRCGNRITIQRPTEPPPPVSSRTGDTDRRSSLTPAPELHTPSSVRRAQQYEGMVHVPGFTLESTFERQPVAIAPFYIDRTPVTNAQYQVFVDETGARPPAQWTGRRPPPALMGHPVVDVSLADARDYARWRRRRLPTDLEWQAASRWPDNRRFPWGDEWDPARCVGPHSGATGTVAVNDRTDGASACGCLHLVGNVWEWTEADQRSRAPEAGYSWVFGGSYCHPCHANGAIARNSVSSSNSYRYLGFRCAADV